jgi:hypothetical protein
LEYIGCLVFEGWKRGSWLAACLSETCSSHLKERKQEQNEHKDSIEHSLCQVSHRHRSAVLPPYPKKTIRVLDNHFAYPASSAGTHPLSSIDRWWKGQKGLRCHRPR